jgi:DNA-binding NarL/FixJ family response regulator
MTSEVKVRILVVDDHEIVREGIRTLLEKERPEWEICGEAGNANEAIEAVKKFNPNLVVLDITMPGMSGLEAARRIGKLALSCRVLMFTMHESDRLGVDVRESGAQGYVLKSQAASDLVVAIEALLRGGTFFGAHSANRETREHKAKAGSSFCECAALATA